MQVRLSHPGESDRLKESQSPFGLSLDTSCPGALVPTELSVHHCPLGSKWGEGEFAAILIRVERLQTGPRPTLPERVFSFQFSA